MFGLWTDELLYSRNLTAAIMKFIYCESTIENCACHSEVIVVLSVCVKDDTICRTDGQCTQKAAYVLIPPYSEKLSPIKKCHHSKVSFPLYSVDLPKKL